MDVVVPLIERDLDVARLCVEGIRACLAHPIGSIYLVSPESERIRHLCDETRCSWVDEASLLADLAPFDYLVDGVDRSGWLRQQIVKLSADAIATAPHVLLLDADTVLVRPQVYRHQGRTIFNITSGFHVPYRRAYARLLGERPRGVRSFTSHGMLFDAELLRAMKERIERLHGMGWREAYVAAADRSDMSGISEYEVYGLYHSSEQPTLELHWYNLELPREELEDFATLARRWDAYKSVSFHWWSRWG